VLLPFQDRSDPHDLQPREDGMDSGTGDTPEGAGSPRSGSPGRRRLLKGAGLAGAAGVAGALLPGTDAQAATPSSSLTDRTALKGAATTQAYLPLPTGTQTAGDAPVATSTSEQTIWTPVATLDSNGKVPTSELPVAPTNLVLAGSSAPGAADGLSGDNYINTSTGQMYYKTSGGVWTQNGLVGQGLLATTGLSGFALQSGAGNVISWTAPNDGSMHRVLVFAHAVVTNAPQTGGEVNVSFTDPDNAARVREFLPGGNSATGYVAPVGVSAAIAQYTYLIAPGSTFALQQTAMSAGAETVYAELWGS
jgi:hypothetical protein